AFEVAMAPPPGPTPEGVDPGRPRVRYSPLNPARPENPHCPPVMALPVPRPYGSWGRVTRFAIEESLPDAIAALVQWLTQESGFQVTTRDRPDEFAPIQPRDVCILFRRFFRFNQATTAPYVQGLEARGIPHVLIGGGSVKDREEAHALLNALVAIEWPGDQLSVYATLKGPLCGLHDDQLLASIDRVGRLHPMRRVEPEELLAAGREAQEVHEALSVIAALHVGRNRRPIAETIRRLLEAVRAHAAFAIWPNGDQALMTIGRLLDLARRFEATGAVSFRAFVEHLQERLDGRSLDLAPPLEEGSEGVRLMTVHKAKGLEFPVVILADPTCHPAPERPYRVLLPERGIYADTLCGAAPLELARHAQEELRREREESARVLYVATTRARDMLCVPVVGDTEIEDSWLGPLAPVVHPPSAGRRKPRHPGGAFPPFGSDSVVRDSGAAGASVQPGLHRPRRGTTDVVWWDPAALPLNKTLGRGLRRQELLIEDPGGEGVAEGKLQHDRWKRRLAQAIEAGRRPTERVHAVSTWVRTGDEGGGVDEEGFPLPAASPARVPAARPVEILRAKGAGTERPGGRRFGTLVHATLSTAPLGAGREQVARDVAAWARKLGASAPEREAAADVVLSALSHPLLEEAHRSGTAEPEVPVTFLAPDGTAREGVIDLYFTRTGEGGAREGVVIDFKTDRELEPQRAHYENQVAAYVEAVEAATGTPARGVLLVL
ncbi:MAG: 3'-5' exonuclease, partial [Planctomycetota bacterium]